MIDDDTLARAAYRAWCEAQGTTPRPWDGPGALPEHRKVVWRATAEAVRRALAGRWRERELAVPQLVSGGSQNGRAKPRIGPRWWERERGEGTGD